MQHAHILHFSSTNNIFYKPTKKKSRRIKSGERGGPGMAPPPPSSYRTIRKLPVRKAQARREKLRGAPSNWKTLNRET
jgi:hypothetical protein